MQINRCIRWLSLAFLMLAIPAASFAQIGFGLSITIAPPALPVYVQPPCPTPGYMWTPGYWAYGPAGYFWVPGTWVAAPAVGVLWTPGYWGWGGGAFLWHAGYWGPHIGFYGGVNYGFGYGGVGFVGGQWQNGAFAYNRSVTNVTNITNVTNVHVYNQTVINNTTVNNVSYNGGTGGTAATPTPAEQAAAKEQHTPPTAEQRQQEHAASTNPSLRESVNHGKPAIAATSKPGQFSGRGVVAAKAAGAAYKPAAERSAAFAGTQRNVPRPPAVSHSTPPARTNAMNAPHPPSASEKRMTAANTPRPPASSHNNSAPHPNQASKSAPHPSNTPHGANGARSQPASHSEKFSEHKEEPRK